MEKQETGLEVHLVNRADHGKSGVDKSFYAAAVKTEIHNGNRYLRVYEETALSSYPSLCDLLMKNYYILAVAWEPGDGVGKVEEAYSISEEDQNDAYETIDQILSDTAELEAAEQEKEQETDVVGPKRIEIVIRRTGQPLEEQSIVVTSLTASDEKFKYTSAGGRNWKKGALSRSVQFYNSNMYWLTKITCFAGGLSGSLTETFIASESDQKRAWEKLEREFSHFKPAELTILREWTPKSTVVTADDDDDEWGGSVHYYNRVPSAYQPKAKPVASMRVAGDEIGVTLYREQQDRRQIGSWPRSLAELVALEKSIAAKKAEEAKKSEEEKKANESSSGSAPPAEPFCDCGSPMCTECYEEYFAKHHRAVGGVGGCPPGVTIH